MNGMNEENDRIERLLEKARPAEPSAELRERVLCSAGNAWNESATLVPWWNGVRWLAASAAAAVLIVSFANYLSDRALAPWQSGGALAARVEDSPTEEFLEISYGPLLKCIVAARRSAGRDAFTLPGYVERMRETLAETERSGASDTLAPGEGRSRMVPAGSSCHSWS